MSRELNQTSAVAFDVAPRRRYRVVCERDSGAPVVLTVRGTSLAAVEEQIRRRHVAVPEGMTGFSVTLEGVE